MKSKLFVLFYLLLFSFFLYSNEASPFPILFVEKADIRIDGSNSDWPFTFPFIMESDNQVKKEMRDRPDEFFVKVWALFDSSHFYIYAEFTDLTPLMNSNIENDIYLGDCLEIYLGFREEKNSQGFGENDFQFGIAMNKDNPNTWIWNKGKVLSGERINIIETQTGYHMEARIPLSNFNQGRLSGNETVWIDFGADNGKGEGIRATQIIWNGDGNGWQTPKTWKKAELVNDLEKMKLPLILFPSEMFSDSYIRIYFFNQAKPWTGEVKIGSKVYKPDANGGVSFNTKKTGKIKAEFMSESINGSTSLLIDKKEEIQLVSLPIRDIKVNQLGYSVKDKKIFILTDNERMLESKRFQVITPLDKKKVFEGKISGPVEDKLTGDLLYYGDFSSFKRTGKYRIHISDQFSDSYVFKIAKNINQELFYQTMRSCFLQRCGTKVHDKDISGVEHEACHIDDAALIEPFRSEQKISHQDVTGGWHDAGDYGKYIPTAGLTVTQILMLYELAPRTLNKFKLDIPESHNKYADVLDEVKVELDWMLKMQASSGGVYHKVNTINFPANIIPESDVEQRYIYEISTSSTAILTGTMGAAYRVFNKIDKEQALIYKKAMMLGLEFLIENLDKPDQVASADNTGAYATGSSQDEIFWAFAEGFRVTNETRYFEIAMKAKGDGFQYPIIGWENSYSLGLYALYYAQKTPGYLKKQIKKFIKVQSDELVEKINQDGYKVSLTQSEFTWASNKNACSKGMGLVLAYQIIKNRSYLQAAYDQVHYILGVNALSKSFLTDIGADSVRYPHHRYVIATDTIVPGLLVGGPNNYAEDGTYKKNMGPKGYYDNYEAFSCNEYAIDYNAPFVFLTGYFMENKNFNRGFHWIYYLSGIIIIFVILYRIIFKR